MLLVAFLLLVVLEVELIDLVWEAIGSLPTLSLLLGMGGVGWSLTRREGARTLLGLMRKEGLAASLELVQAGLLLAAGFLFLFPGFATDAAALLLLFPPARRLLAKRLLASGHFRIHAPPRAPAGPGVIEGEYRREATAPEREPPTPGGE